MSSKLLQAYKGGRTLNSFTDPDLARRFGDFLDAARLYGIDFDFFTSDMIKLTVAKLKQDYPYLKDTELSYVLCTGCEGGFSRYPLQKFKPYLLYNWIDEYIQRRNKILSDVRDYEEFDYSNAVNLLETPFGSAICWKIANCPLDAWELVDLEKLAELIRSGHEDIHGYFGIKKLTSVELRRRGMRIFSGN